MTTRPMKTEALGTKGCWKSSFNSSYNILFFLKACVILQQSYLTGWEVGGLELLTRQFNFKKRQQFATVPKLKSATAT